MADICRETGITPQTLRNWRAGECLPNQENWEQLAKVLNTTVRDLLREKAKVRLQA